MKAAESFRLVEDRRQLQELDAVVAVMKKQLLSLDLDTGV
jgi:hypothetical protein